MLTSNENLVPSSQIENQGIQNFGNSNLNTEMEVYADLTNPIGYTIFPFILIILFIFVFTKVYDENESTVTIVFSFIFLILLTIIFLIFFYSTLKFTFTKDLYSNFLYVRRKNFFCFSLERCDFQLNDILVDIIGKNTEKSISIVKVHKDFDINTFTIAKIPPKTYYILSDIKNVDNLKNKLSEFIGCPPEDENPVMFDMYKYMGKPKPQETRHFHITFGKHRLSLYMKFNEKFFSFYLNISIFSLWGIVPFGILFNICFICSIILTIYKNVIIVAIIFGLITIIVNIILIYCCIYYNKRLRRIDIMFSNDFTKIFIGLINDKENKYLNYFIFDIINIDNFTLDIVQNYDNEYNLNVVFKDKNIQNICRIKGHKICLEGLLYILNNYKKSYTQI